MRSVTITLCACVWVVHVMLGCVCVRERLFWFDLCPCVEADLAAVGRKRHCVHTVDNEQAPYTHTERGRERERGEALKEH